MPATVLARPLPFSATEHSTFIVMDPITATTTGIPIRTEIDGGDNITAAVTDFAGGDKSSNSTDELDFSSLTPQKVPSANTQNDITLTTLVDVDGTDVQAILTEGDDYTLMVTDQGETAAGLADVYFVTVASVSKPLSTTGGRKRVYGLIVTRSFVDIVIPT